VDRWLACFAGVAVLAAFAGVLTFSTVVATFARADAGFATGVAGGAATGAGAKSLLADRDDRGAVAASRSPAKFFFADAIAPDFCFLALIPNGQRQDPEADLLECCVEETH
jgi:hypothetical protein